MLYTAIEKHLRPNISGSVYWLWRISRVRIEEISWIIRRIFRLNHIVSGYYGEPAFWKENRDRSIAIAKNIRGDCYRPAVLVHGILPRCGSNIVHDIIDSHPDVVGGEIGINEFPILCNCRAMDAFYSSVVSRYRKFSETVSGIEMMSFLLSGIMRDIQVRIGADKCAVLKVPSVQHLEMFDALFPRDKLVVVIRDGRDIAHSTRKTWKGNRSFLRSDVAIAREYTNASLEIEQCKQHMALRGNDNIYIFRYEDYVHDPRKAVKALYLFLDLTIDDSILDKAVNLPVRGSSSMKAAGGRASWTPTEKPADFSPVEKWKGWSHARVRRFANEAQQALITLGYEKSKK